MTLRENRNSISHRLGPHSTPAMLAAVALASVLTSVMSAGSAAAEIPETTAADAATETTTPTPPAKSEGWLDSYYPYQERVGGWIDNSARGIDSFFGTDAAWLTDNQSWLRVASDFRWDKTDRGTGEIRPQLKLDLPTASKRLHLIIENDNPEQRTAAQDTVPSLRNTNTSRNTVLGLGYDMDSWAPLWKKQIQAGISGVTPLNPYARFIAKRNWKLGGDWVLNSYNRVAWFNTDGYSVKSEIRIGEPLAPRWHLDYTTLLVWREDRDYLQFTESANLVNVLSPRSAISYSTGVVGTGATDPEITGYFISADYRRNVSRRLIFLDVIPELSFPKTENFDPHWAITLRLELYFQKSTSSHD